MSAWFSSRPSAHGPRRSRTRKHQRPVCRLTVERLEDRNLLAADPVLAWNAVALQADAVDQGLAAPDQVGPGRIARAFAIVHTAIYDAVNGIARTHEPYLVHARAPQLASVDAAVAGAAHRTLVAMFPQQKATFDAELRDALAGVPNGLRERLGVAWGRFVAQRVLAARRHDRSDLEDPYTPTNEPGHHQLDPLHPEQGFWGPSWGEVKPFAIPSVRRIRTPPPPAMDSPAYTAAFNEVKSLGGDGINTPTTRTPEQTIIGKFWGYDGRPGLGTPPRLYNQVTRVLAVQQDNTPAENARLFALVNIAQADAGIQSWYYKYLYDCWRPVMGIRDADHDGNPNTVADTHWKYLGAPGSNGGNNFTPPFPAYTSGHATIGAAMFKMVANYYGRDRVPFSFTSDEFNGVTTDADGTVRPVVTRTYASFSQAAEENGQSRIYLGIHWSFDKTEGIRAGNRIANYIFRHYLRPLPRAGFPRGFVAGNADRDSAALVAALAAPRPLAWQVAADSDQRPNGARPTLSGPGSTVSDRGDTPAALGSPVREWRGTAAERPNRASIDSVFATMMEDLLA
jgi:hypothetical protein